MTPATNPLRNSRYGWRATRVGEASNPGPPRVRRRVLSSSSEDDHDSFLSDFERDLVGAEPVSVSNRFSPLYADREAANARDHQSQESGTESLVSMNGSEGPELGEVVEEVVVEEPLVAEFRVSLIFREALVSLVDEIHLETEFRTRANLMRSAPKFLEGAYLSAMRLAMEEIRQRRRTN